MKESQETEVKTPNSSCLQEEQDRVLERESTRNKMRPTSSRRHKTGKLLALVILWQTTTLRWPPYMKMSPILTSSSKLALRAIRTRTASLGKIAPTLQVSMLKSLMLSSSEMSWQLKRRRKLNFSKLRSSMTESKLFCKLNNSCSTICSLEAPLSN